MRRHILIASIGGIALSISLFGAGAVATASPRWIARYDGPANGPDSSTGVVLRRSVLFHAVTSRGTGLGQDFLLIARDAEDGSKLWSRRYDGPAHAEDHLSDVAVSPDGSRVYVTGWSTGPDGTYDWATLAYDAETGHRSWLRVMRGSTRGHDLPSALIVSPHGARVFVAGSTINAGTKADATTVAYDADSGSRLWTQRIDGSAHHGDAAYDLVASLNGAHVYVAGRSARQGSGSDAMTMAFDAVTGAVGWRRLYDGPGQEGADVGGDYGGAISLAPDGSAVYVAGATVNEGTGYSDYLTIAYRASDGKTSWRSSYDGRMSGEDETHDVVVSPDGGTVFVSGVADERRSAGRIGGLDATTIAYRSASGDIAWLADYDGPSSGYDSGNDLAMPSDGTLYVSGASRGIGTQFDMVQLTYRVADGALEHDARFDGPAHRRDQGRELALSTDGRTLYQSGTVRSVHDANDAVLIAYPA
jgi:hypothetical protein